MECKCSSYNDFNCKSYSDRYPDLKNAYSYNCKKLHNHWITKGQLEGRIACKDVKDFDWQSYYFRYDDLKVLGYNFNNLFDHWKKFGQIEGRDASIMAKKKYSLIGNCQCIHLNTFLQTNSHFMSEYSYIDVKPIYLTSKNEIDFIYDFILPQLDLLIIQPIKNNYKNYYKYSTKYILGKINENCKVIMFPSLYFNGYFPNVVNYRIKHINLAVHDKNLIKIFKMTEDKKSFLKKCEDIINSNNFYNETEVINNVKGSLFILRIKEEKAKLEYDPVHFIKVSDYIESNFQKALLFYSLNHCSKHIYSFLSDKVLEYLKVTKMSYDINLDPQKNAENMILYNSVRKKINPNLKDDIFAQRGIVTNNLREYLEFHYDKYSQIKSYMLNLEIPE